jgi:drug/metabolite transporter (DMT)-like permease
MFSMVAPYSEWPLWVRVAVLAPLALLAGAPEWGWWPRTVRQWRLFGIALACFTFFCLVMICAFHYA